jgi:DNA polymerase-3 subunit gamma/tau
MSYLVFARKWRPLTFDDVVGQEHITATLKKAIEKNRVAHAFIFTGTRGVGKTTTARILARALNCDKGPTANPCGVCEPCKNIISGSSFDVLEIDGASNNSVDDIREIRDNVRYSSMGGKYRIYVIDEVHMLTKNAFNALLKTLEEPPKNVIFIFATTEPQKIPATIHSRCQRFDFKRISTEQITGRLEYICKEENIAFDHSALLLVGRKAEGSMRDGLSLLDQVYSYSHESINEVAVRAALGIISTDIYETILDAIANKNPASAISVVEDILSRGFDLSDFVGGLQDYLRTMLFSRIPGVSDNARIDFGAGVTDTLKKQAGNFSDATILRMAEIVRKTENELKWNTFPRFLVEIMLMKLVHLDETVTMENILSALGNPPQNATVSTATQESADKKKTDLTPVAQPAPLPDPVQNKVDTLEYESVEPSKPASVVSESPATETPSVNTGSQAQKNLHTDWTQFIDHLQKKHPPLGYYLSVAYIGSVSDSSIDLRFPAAFVFQHAEVMKKKNRDDIQHLLNEFFNVSIEMHITMETKNETTAAHSKSPLMQQAQGFASIDDEIAKEPIIKTVLEIFDGTVL